MKGENDETIANGLFLKAGRNLLLFQEIEHLLKDLVSMGAISLPEGSERENAMMNQSLGMVVKAFAGRHLEGSKIPQPGPEADEVSVRTGFVIQGEAADELSQRLSRAVSDRNNLAHHLLTSFDLQAEEGRQAAMVWLEESFAEHNSLLTDVLQYHETVRRGFEEIFSYLRTHEGHRELFLPEIRSTTLVQNLSAAALVLADSDGWTPLAEAVSELPRTEIQATLSALRLRSLTDLITSSKLFELRADQTPSGGTRMMYRLQPLDPPVQSGLV